MKKKQNFQSYPDLQETKINSELDQLKESIIRKGIYIKKSVYKKSEIAKIRKKIDKIWESQLNEYGKDFLKNINEFGSVRCMVDYDEIFLDLVSDPRIFNDISSLIGETSILHLQNGIILFPENTHNQSNYHKDFPKNFISDEILSVNALIVIDRFDQISGGTYFVPGSHKFKEMPSDSYIRENEIQVFAEPGDVIFFDSMLWHKGGQNTSSKPRRAINQQYTKPFIKQQISYPDLLKNKVDRDSKLGQVLGMWSVPPRNLKEYRVDDPSKRTYRGGQG
tara:strand:+ start:2878 stop:3714 length:837 start_codon:yes stop_codon:yes gene_type:complete